jgi:hypothetical protein
MASNPTTRRFHLIGLLAVILGILLLEGSSDAAPRRERIVSEFTSFIDDAAIGPLPRETVEQIAEIQAQVATPANWPQVFVQAEQRLVPVAQRNDVYGVAQSIRARQADRTRPLFVTTREGAAQYSFAHPPALSPSNPGAVRLVNNRIQIQMADDVIYDLGFRVNSGTRPSAAQVESALRELPGGLASQPVAPTTLVYQEGKFWLATEGTDAIILLQPLSVGVSRADTRVASLDTSTAP